MTIGKGTLGTPDFQEAFNALEAAALQTPAANQADSVASDTAGIVSDFNGLLDKLKTAGLMVADE
jgi:hypothetical protein